MISKEKILQRELKLSKKTINNRDKSQMPDFSWGEEYIFGKKCSDPLESLVNFSQDWMKNPLKYLNLDNYKLPEITRTKNIISFPSILNNKDTANFYIDFPPKLRTNKEILAIMLPYWGFRLKEAKRNADIVRSLFLPISVAMYAPQHGNLDMDSYEDQYATLGPNLGLTLSYFWQDVLNLIYFTEYIKKEFKHVGYISFSLGNTRAIPAGIFSDVDFMVLHLLPDNLANSVLNGEITKDIAKPIKEKISSETLSKIWTPMNPGAYEKYFNKLPKHIRLVQGLFDLALEIDNCKEITRKLKPFAEIEEGQFGHSTIIGKKNSIPMIIKDANFVKNHFFKK